MPSNLAFLWKSLKPAARGKAARVGRTHVDEVNEELELNLPEDGDYETVGGFAFSQLGRIPAVGEWFQWTNVRFTVLEVSKRKINRLRLEVTDADWAVDPPDAALTGLAAELGLDTEAFESCVGSRVALERVVDDLYDVSNIFGSTPTFVVLYDGRASVIEGAQPFEQFAGRHVPGCGGEQRLGGRLRGLSDRLSALHRHSSAARHSIPTACRAFHSSKRGTRRR